MATSKYIEGIIPDLLVARATHHCREFNDLVTSAYEPLPSSARSGRCEVEQGKATEVGTAFFKLMGVVVELLGCGTP